jgi:hypothetical protein
MHNKIIQKKVSANKGIRWANLSRNLNHIYIFGKPIYVADF